MLTSLAFVFLAGLAAAAVCSAIKLPRIIGMLLVGIVLGPHILNVLDDSILSISSELRQMALIIILLKAGLSLNLSDLRQVGRPALVPACDLRTRRIHTARAVSSRCQPHRGRCYRGRTRSCLSGRCRAAHGLSYGKSMGHGQEHSPNAAGRCIM